jgi:flavin reductase (DIM6/NTAB) family NADH-FMN oxidoreductase RutF
MVTQPAILYSGTPVVLISTVNEDGTPILAPMSSAWWLGQRCVLGLAVASKTTQNLRRTGECVLNLPSDAMATHVDRIARTTGSKPVPDGKARRGYRYVGDKFATAGLTPVGSLTVKAPRALECPVQLEAVLEDVYPLADQDPAWRGRSVALHVAIRKVHAATEILADASPTGSIRINGAR